jgi:hypothetical protein
VGALGESKASVAARLSGRIASGSPKSIVTVGELVTDWLQKAAPKRKGPSWLATCQNLVDVHTMPRFRHRDLADLTVEEVEKWMADMSVKLSKATVSKVRSQLAQALDYRSDVWWSTGTLPRSPNCLPDRG